MALDAKDMLTRRCHSIDFDYVTSVKLHASFKRISCAEYLKTRPFNEKNATISWRLHHGRDEGLYKIRPSIEAVRQLIDIEKYAPSTYFKSSEYYRAKLPWPTNPDFHIFLPSGQNPSASDMIVHIRDKNGEYRKAGILDMAKYGPFAVSLFSKFGNCLADISTVSMTVNQAQIKNPTDFQEGVIFCPEWKFGITTVDGNIVVYEPEDGEFEVDEGGYHLDGVYYPVETAYDKQALKAIWRLKNAESRPPSRASSQLDLRIEDTLEASPARCLIREIVGFFDLTLTAVLSGAMIADLFHSDPLQLEADMVGTSAVKQRKKQPLRLERRKAPPPRPTNKNDSPPTGPKAASSMQFERRKAPPPRPTNKNDSPPTGPKATNNWRLERRRTPLKKIQNSPPVVAPSELPQYGPQLEPEWVPSSIDIAPWSVAVFANGPVDQCEYGIVAGDFFHFATKITGSDNWRFCVMHTMQNSWPFRRVTEPKKFTQDLQSKLANLVGQTFTPILNEREHDVSSILAHYLFDGSFKDLDADKTYKTMPNWLKAWKYEPLKWEEQGCYDHQAIADGHKLYKNMYHIIHSNMKIMNAVMLKENLGLTNYHAPKEFTIASPTDYSQTWNCVRIAGSFANDVALFRVTDKQWPASPNIMSCIPRHSDLTKVLSKTGGKFAAVLLLSTPVESQLFVSATTAVNAVKTVYDRGEISYTASIAYFGSTGVTQRGDCGSPVIMMAPGFNAKFIGIHARGNTSTSQAVPITQEYLEDLLQNPLVPESNNVPSRHIDYYGVPLEKEGFTVVGEPKYKVHVPRTTTKYRTPLKLETNFEPSIKSKGDPRNIARRDLLKEGLLKYAAPQLAELDQQEVNAVFEEIGDYFADVMQSRGITLEILNNTDSINGSERLKVPNSKGIDRTGSAGYPYTTMFPGKSSKADYLRMGENGLWYFSKDGPGEKMLADTNKLVIDAKAGIPHDIPWIAYPKDEPVKLAKIYDQEKLKTRVFFSGPMHYQIAYRRYYQSAIWAIMQCHDILPIRVGITPTSLDWTHLAHQHLQVGELGWDSDYADWDMNVPIELMKGVVYMYNRLYKRLDPDWKPEDDTARFDLHAPVEGALVILYDMLIKFLKGMMSGYPGTAVDNSAINLAVYYLSWKRIMLRHAPQHSSFAAFLEFVRTSFYGDDNFVTVVEEFLKWFNFNTFTAEAAKLGFKVTDAAKTGEKQPDFKHLSDMDFLKRKFIHSGKIWIAPLAVDSILKSFCWVQGGKPYEFRGDWRVTRDERLITECMSSSWTELAYHGKEVYEHVVDKIRRALVGTGLTVVIKSYSSAVMDGGLFVTDYSS
jgi:hypothetical protein